MRKRLLAPIFMVACFQISAQTKKSFSVEPGQKMVDAIPVTDLYSHPQFTLGTVQLKDNSEAVVKLNYNKVFGEMQYIDPAKGDTLSLAEEKNIRFVAIEKDTFYFDEIWLHFVSGNSTLKLAKKQMLEISNKEKLGVFGTPALGGSIETYNKFTGSQHMKDLVAKERITFTEHISYYFGDRFNHYLKANKKGLLKMYSKQEKELEKWLDENKIDYNKEDDLKKLFTYLETL
jgi:hypothetical protein